ncbi:MAG: DUF3006 domain-containing protein [Clostridia bacterium]|nr:DUF3006 domain-containing protein [Clostridia bacterium]
MDFLENLGEAIQKTISKEDIKKIEIKNDQGACPFSQEEIELAEKLDAIEEFTVDRFEGDIVVLEDRKTGNMINVNKDEVPDIAREGEILKRINGKYMVNKEKTQEVSDRIKNKMDDLWN